MASLAFLKLRELSSELNAASTRASVVGEMSPTSYGKPRKRPSILRWLGHQEHASAKDRRAFPFRLLPVFVIQIQ